MSIQSIKTCLAIAGMLSTAAAIAIPGSAGAVPRLGTYSVICADGADISVVSPGPPDPMSVCGGHGYNGGKISPTGPRVLTEAQALPAGVRADAVAAPDAATEAWTGEAAVPDRPRDAGAAGGGNIPVLNCSQSQNSPALLDLSTAASSGWSLANTGGASVPLMAASNVAWSAVPGGQWVGPGGASAAIGTWTYARQVRINACPKGRSATLTVVYRSDNRATFQVKDPSSAVITTANQTGTTNYGFLPASLTNHSYTFAPGANGVYTLVFSVANISGPTGLSAKVALAR